MTNRHCDIALPFMIAGHTKFSCDRYFGLIKKRYLRSKVDTISGIARVVEESSQGYNIPQLVRSPNQELLVKTYDWVAFFESQGFRNIPNILQYHIFQFSSSHPGTIFV